MPETITRPSGPKDADPTYDPAKIKFRAADLFDPAATYRVVSRSATLEDVSKHFDGTSYGVRFVEGVALLPPVRTEDRAEKKLWSLMQFYNTNPVGVQYMDGDQLKWRAEPAYTIEKLTRSEASQAMSETFGVEDEAEEVKADGKPSPEDSRFRVASWLKKQGEPIGWPPQQSREELATMLEKY